jgi:hypothetical protein
MVRVGFRRFYGVIGYFYNMGELVAGTFRGPWDLLYILSRHYISCWIGALDRRDNLSPLTSFFLGGETDEATSTTG